VDSRGVAVGTMDPTPAAFAWAPRAATTTGLGALESEINGSQSGANAINDRREVDVNDAGQVLGDGLTPPTASSVSRFVLTLPGEADPTTMTGTTAREAA
jgi:hypothetical protein